MKNNISIFAIPAILLAASSCKPSLAPVDTPDDFDARLVTIDAVEGERVSFDIAGDVDFINFYSGEPGSDYEYKDKDRLYQDEMLLSFSTAQYPKNGTNPDCGRFYWSNDFPGIYEETWIKLATWHDITDKIVYPKLSDTNYVLYDTNDLPISEFFAEDTELPIYFCWKFSTAANSKRTRFRIDNWSIHGKQYDKEFYSFVSSAFTMVQGKGCIIEPSSTYYPRVTDKYILWDGVWESTVEKEGWAISAPIKFAKAINAGHDKGLSIKTIGDPVMRNYNYYYSAPGTYFVVFEAINANAVSQKSKTVKITVNVAPAKDKPIEEEKYIEISSIEGDALNIPAEGGSAKFGLRCLSRWEIAVDSTWAAADITEGSGGHLYTVGVSAGPNDTGAPRECTLTISTADLKQKTIRICQGTM